MNKEEAKIIVKDFINSSIAIAFTHVFEFEQGFVLCYQSQKYLETKSLGDLLFGNVPLYIHKESQEIYSLPPLPSEKAIADYVRKYMC